jgi:hypothetical protein
MNAEAAVRKALVDDPAVAALVGDRITPMVLKQGTTLPAIVCQGISRVPDQPTLEGATARVPIRLQLSLWAATFDGARELAAAVEARLDGYSGQNGDGTGLRLVYLLNMVDDYEPDTKLYRVIADYRVIHTEGVAA